MTIKYFVFDCHTGYRAGSAKGYDNVRVARRAADRLDSIYGAVRYTVRRVEVAE